MIDEATKNQPEFSELLILDFAGLGCSHLDDLPNNVRTFSTVALPLGL